MVPERLKGRGSLVPGKLINTSIALKLRKIMEEKIFMIHIHQS
jgi:hypothetical protein